MRKKAWMIAAGALALLVVLVILIYPNIEFKKNGKLYACSFSEDFSKYEENPSYNELYFYNEKHDISLKNFTAEHFLCFYVLSFDYIEGDFRQTQFMLEAAYMENWLENAEIQENPAGIDLAALIEGKEPVVSNTRYTGNNYDRYITYVLDDQWQTLSVFESEGLIVIQVGSTDELPKFIAYK